MKIGFLGFGNLAKSLYNGLILSKKVQPSDFIVNAKSDETLNYAKSLGITAVKTVGELFELSDVVVLAVKPKVFDLVASDLPKDFSSKKIVSVMAMRKIEKLREVFGCAPVIRIMPSLSAAYGSDLIGVCGDAGGFDDFIEKLRSAGDLLYMSEDKLEAFTVAASCGLGFAAYMLNAYENAVKTLGFSSEEAKLITEVTFKNSANYSDYSKLYDLVATKGGATEQGLLKMNEGGLNEIIADGVKKAYDKATGKI